MNNLTRKRILIVLAGVFVFLSVCYVFAPTRNIVLYVFKPPLYAASLLKREITGLFFFHRNMVLNERLRKENNLLRNKINSLNEIYLENNRLKTLLSLKKQSSFKVIAAKVIGRSNDNWSSVIVIDRGTMSGVRRGMSVINYLGLIGRVIEVSSGDSKILLLSDPNMAVSAIVQRSRQEGLVSGTLGARLVMRYLPEEPDLKVGDKIVTSGLNPAYPKGLLIGKVIEVAKEFSTLSRYAIIEPAANLSNIEEVLVIVQ